MAEIGVNRALAGHIQGYVEFEPVRAEPALASHGNIFGPVFGRINRTGSE